MKINISLKWVKIKGEKLVSGIANIKGVILMKISENSAIYQYGRQSGGVV